MLAANAIIMPRGVLIVLEQCLLVHERAVTHIAIRHYEGLQLDRMKRRNELGGVVGDGGK